MGTCEVTCCCERCGILEIVGICEGGTGDIWDDCKACVALLTCPLPTC